MRQSVQTALYNLLAGNQPITSKLANGANSIIAASEMTAETPLPVLLLENSANRKTTFPHFYEEWIIYVLDRGNGYYRIAGILELIQDLLDGSSLNVTGNAQCFEVEWMGDIGTGLSRPFRAETGGAVVRLYLSK